MSTVTSFAGSFACIFCGQFCPDFARYFGRQVLQAGFKWLLHRTSLHCWGWPGRLFRQKNRKKPTAQYIIKIFTFKPFRSSKGHQNVTG